MPITIRRRIHLFGPFYINIGRTGVSLTTRVGPAGYTINTNGTRTRSLNLPGKGVGYRSTTTSARHRATTHRGPSEEERDYEQTRAALQARKDAALARRAARRRRRSQ